LTPKKDTDASQTGFGDALFGTRLDEVQQTPEGDAKRTGGGELFVVDNSISGWTGLRYLKEWCAFAESMDVATGYFEIGALLELDGEWQKLKKIRILMGSETTARTKALLVKSLRERAEQRLEDGLNEDKDTNPFGEGIPSIVDALKSRQIEVKVYREGKFHAKCYITHALSEIIGPRALVGSSNFTKPGLTENVELNIQVQSGSEVADLQNWFEVHWERGEEVTDEILTLISRHTREYQPFEIYTKALHEYFHGHEITASEFEESRSKVFPQLDQYQKEAYWSLMKIGRQHGGALLCDGVGMGKTFVGLMLIERLILHEGKRVVLFAPKGAREGVWEPDIKKWLGHIGGVGGSADFSNLAVFNHTDLNREGDYPERFRRMTELADAVIIDEAHHFRNLGTRGDESTGEGRSRYYKLFDMLDDSVRNKMVFMLTATPINNRLTDFRHMVELFSRGDEAYFARTLGVNSLTGHFAQMERVLRNMLGHDDVDLTENLMEATDLLSQDTTFKNLVVQRSRAYAQESQKSEGKSEVNFPKRLPPRVAEYSIRENFGALLEMMENAFAKHRPLFSLPIYYPLYYYTGTDEDIDALEEGRQKQVVGLIRTQFLKRFESSIAAFELSSDRLLKKLLAFMEVHSETESEIDRLERWKRQNAQILNYASERQLLFWSEHEDQEEEEDIVSPEMLASVEKLSRDEFNVQEMMSETMLDLDQIVTFLKETRKFKPSSDDKLNKLKRLLKTKALKDQKVLIFTEYADTARYLHRQLREAGIDGLDEVDGGTAGNRGEIIKRFAPYYNDSDSTELQRLGRNEIRVLISTDVLAEGLNLQDASYLINYDIHWNPVRLMQRIGRIDRRFDPAIERQIVEDHPERASSRGKVEFWNFLPPDELNAILTLYTRVTHKTLLISKTMGIEGKKLLTPEDDYDALREFNHEYEGTKSAIEEMHLEYQNLLRDIPGLAENLDRLPHAVFSGKATLKDQARGAFFCYALPALDRESGEFTEQAGSTRWYLFDTDTNTIFEEPGEIVRTVRSYPETPRRTLSEKVNLIEIREKILKHITNTYLKRIDAPMGIRPSLKCWMDLN
jgi:superfamily II DNA or RNA helicase